MSKTLNEIQQEIQVAKIVHMGEQLILPEGMDMDGAIGLLKRRKQYLEEEISLSEVFAVFPWDAAVALNSILNKRYGWSPAERTPSMFGSRPPEIIAVETSIDTVVHVPWGRFSLPAIEGWIDCGVTRKDGRISFRLNARILRKDETQIKSLFEELRTELKANSIYRGKAFKMRFRDEDGDIIDMPEPKFIDTNDVDEAMLVYPAKTQAAIETNLFTPIQRIRDCIANGIPVKRGVLLGGTFGTGKTMAAKVASKYAVQNGITYLYVTRADELADAIEFAKMYCDPGCVIFCEDIDRAMEGNNAERTEAIDDILNIIDGIDTKSSNIITVLTTNSLETITPAMLRPGRLDAVIDVLPPDAAAAEKLVRLYAGGAVDIDADLSEVGQKLNGVIPAVIAEVVKRAKLAQLRLQEPGTLVTKLSAKALLDASESMKSQLDLLYREEVKDETTIDSLVKGAIESVVTKHLGETISMVSKVDDRVEDIHNRIC